MDELDRTVGLGRVRVWHLNDSRRERGSRVDRHAGIGAGHLGLEPFRHLVNDSAVPRLPMILETPKGTTRTARISTPVNLRVLRQLERAVLRSRPDLTGRLAIGVESRGSAVCHVQLTN